MAVRRIFCIGRNYAAHARELGNAPDDGCVVFLKPPSCVVAPGATLALPRNRGAVHHEAELVVGLASGGRDLDEANAPGHIGWISLGLDLTLRDLQADLKTRGWPWELAKAFDGAAPLGDPVPYDGRDLQAIRFRCTVNDELRQHGDTADMQFPVARLIRILSRTWSLGAGDVIYTGTPAGVGPLRPGDRVSVAADGIGVYAWDCA